MQTRSAVRFTGTTATTPPSSFTFSFSPPVNTSPSPPREQPPRPAGPTASLPNEILQYILDLAPTPLERQAARIAYSGVSRHWYNATQYPVEFAVRRSWQAAALAVRLKKEREESPDGVVAHPARKLFLSLVQIGGIHKPESAAFLALLDECRELDTLHLSFGAEYNAKVAQGLGPSVDEPFGGLDAAIRKQIQLRVFFVTKHNWILPCADLFRVIAPLTKLEILDLTESEVEDVEALELPGRPVSPPQPHPALALPLQCLSVKQLDDPYWSISELLPFAKNTLHKIRVGKLRCDPELDALSPLVAALHPIATQIRHFQCLIYPWHAKFSAHPFLDLNALLVAMTNLEFLELSLATRDDLRAPQESICTDSAIFATLKTLPKVRDLTLHLRAKPSTEELYAFVEQLTIDSFSLAIGVEDPQWIDERDIDQAKDEWKKEVPAKVREIIPEGVRFTASTYSLE